MSTVVWTTLIAAAATVAASLGAVWTKGHFDDRADARKARETSLSEVSDRRRNAYAELLADAREVLAWARFTQTVSDTTGRVGTSEPPKSAADLPGDAASAELLGSARAHPYVRAVDEKAMELLDFYWRTSSSPEPDLVGSFDSAMATAKAFMLEEAINAFVDAVRPELGD